ncbi:MAG: ABC transporter permease, partial [Gammaproteobacteria bacterium]|nr:ABC transporter permease [Gammaproteobacteria bacterium]
TLVVFVVMASAPGGISAQSLVEGQNLEPQAKKALEDYYNKLYGLDSPAPIQYLRWLNNVSPVGFTFDEAGEWEGFSVFKGSNLGKSFLYGRPVTDLIAERVPITALLNIISIPIIYIIAVAIGVRAATQRGQAFDVGSSTFMLGLWSVPTMLTGVLLIGFFASDQYWHWFPTSGLNDRAALDMVFLPHWGSFSDLFILMFSVLFATAFFVWISRWSKPHARAACFAVVGVAMGFFMVEALPEKEQGLMTYFMLISFAAALFGAVAYAQYSVLRVFFMGLVGLAIGFMVAAYFQEGSFIRGFLLDRAWHLVLPVICLTYGGFAFLSKLTRTAMLENLLSDYARTARAKGVSDNDILWRHVFRNSLLPLITVSASLLPSLLGGSVIVESIFSIDGMGKLAVEAVKGRDRELVLSITLISGLLTLLSYLIADLCYALADPRVSYE